MSDRRWFNQSLPQTLQIATFLLYFRAFFAVLDMFTMRLRGLPVPAILPAMFGISALLLLFGGLGVANESKKGYQIAVLASFMPAITRLVLSILAGRFSLAFILGLSNPIGLIFEVALIALLLHNQSKEHQRVWFR